ncbi:MAG: tRNA (adenosine(37)-N6)-threonylcarbamoyltransferase complex dimerization subunit type 1 TsaB, partial [Terriglobales bacterium]
RNYGDELFVVVEALLAGAGATLPEMALIAVADGPGSFTGVRIGLTAAKGWHEVLGTPLAPISTLRAVIGRNPLPGLGAMDAARGEVYFGCYTESGAEEGLEPLAAFQHRLRFWQAAAFTTDESLQRACPALQLMAPELAAAVGWLGWKAGAAGQAQNVMALDARYLRPPDVTLPAPR